MFWKFKVGDKVFVKNKIWTVSELDISYGRPAYILEIWKGISLTFGWFLESEIISKHFYEQLKLF